MKTRFKCVVCGKVTAGRMPRVHARHEGDGSARFPRMHKVDGVLCDGSFMEAEWVDEPREEKLQATLKDVIKKLEKARGRVADHRKGQQCEHPRACGECHFYQGYIMALNEMLGQTGIID